MGAHNTIVVTLNPTVCIMEIEGTDKKTRIVNARKLQYSKVPTPEALHKQLDAFCSEYKVTTKDLALITNNNKLSYTLTGLTRESVEGLNKLPANNGTLLRYHAPRTIAGGIKVFSVAMPEEDVLYWSKLTELGWNIVYLSDMLPALINSYCAGTVGFIDLQDVPMVVVIANQGIRVFRSKVSINETLAVSAQKWDQKFHKLRKLFRIYGNVENQENIREIENSGVIAIKYFDTMKKLYAEGLQPLRNVLAEIRRQNVGITLVGMGDNLRVSGLESWICSNQPLSVQGVIPNRISIEESLVGGTDFVQEYFGSIAAVAAYLDDVMNFGANPTKDVVVPEINDETLMTDEMLEPDEDEKLRRRPVPVATPTLNVLESFTTDSDRGQGQIQTPEDMLKVAVNSAGPAEPGKSSAIAEIWKPVPVTKTNSEPPKPVPADPQFMKDNGYVKPMEFTPILKPEATGPMLKANDSSTVSLDGQNVYPENRTPEPSKTNDVELGVSMDIVKDFAGTVEEEVTQEEVATGEAGEEVATAPMEPMGPAKPAENKVSVDSEELASLGQFNPKMTSNDINRKLDALVDFNARHVVSLARVMLIFGIMLLSIGLIGFLGTRQLTVGPTVEDIQTQEARIEQLRSNIIAQTSYTRLQNRAIEEYLPYLDYVGELIGSTTSITDFSLVGDTSLRINGHCNTTDEFDALHQKLKSLSTKMEVILVQNVSTAGYQEFSFDICPKGVS